MKNYFEIKETLGMVFCKLWPEKHLGSISDIASRNTVAGHRRITFRVC